MQKRMESRKSQAGDGAARQGDTLLAQGETPEEVPRMPHERDESSDSQAPQEPSGQRMGHQAGQDIARGVVDTSKGEAMDETYKRVREVASEPRKK